MDVISKINELQIAPSWKQKFLAISESKPFGGGLVHEFGDKAKYKALPFWTKFSVWGLLIGVLFYFFKGMWKKGLVLMAVNVLVVVLSEAIPALALLLYLPMVIAFAQANIDYYRKMVLGEDFWW